MRSYQNVKSKVDTGQAIRRKIDPRPKTPTVLQKNPEQQIFTSEGRFSEARSLTPKPGTTPRPKIEKKTLEANSALPKARPVVTKSVMAV